MRIIMLMAFHPEASPSLSGAQYSRCREGRSRDPQSSGVSLPGERVPYPGARELEQGLGTAALFPPARLSSPHKALLTSRR